MHQSDCATRFAGLEATIIVALMAFREQATERSRTVVRDSIEIYVDAMRDAELLPETVVITIKRVARRAGLAEPAEPTVSLTLQDQDREAEEFVTCAIERYFVMPSPLG